MIWNFESCTISAVPATPTREKIPHPDTGQPVRFYATTHDDYYIWGVTAGILRTLRDRLYGAPLA